MNPANHPTLKLFRRGMDNKTIDHRKADDFNRFRTGKKCPPGSDLRAAADKLWEEYQAIGAPKVQAYQPPTSMKDRQQDKKRGGERGRQKRGGGPATGRGQAGPSASPACLGEPFHNPYTFIPFPKTPPTRAAPTPLTIDELEPERFTGTLEIELKTQSPLLTCAPIPKEGANAEGHKTYRALAIGNDVIVPSTGVKGALRSLLAIISGGTVSYLDDEVWLCQGRDVNLGPRGPKSPPKTPKECFLGRVEKPGNADSDGTITLGTTHLIKTEKLKGENIDGLRPKPNRVKKLWATRDGHVSLQKDDQHIYQLKLSGRPINRKGKREGLFQANGPTITVPAPLWAAYIGQNRHGERPELKPGDLIWLEPKDPETNEMTRAEDIQSLQWARWGRRGENLKDVMQTHHKDFLPDAFRNDGLVDEVTNLFGFVPRPDLGHKGRRTTKDPEKPKLRAFAARIRPDNLVFQDAMQDGIEKGVPLAPLAPPHPGCAAFYRDAETVDAVVNRGLPLRGYKVYRTTNGKDAPWRFARQGVYDDSGRLKDSPKQKVNKTCDLLKPGQTGHLRIACRGVSQRELALLMGACSVDWRLGGGKPLGLGWCRITRVTAIDEDGQTMYTMTRTSDEPAPLPEGLSLESQDVERLALWHASQVPVERLRYPRSVVENKNKINRGGHSWFGKHASPRKTADSTGLEVLWTMGGLEQKAGADSIQGQMLPRLNPQAPTKDTLFGYDLFFGDREDLVEQRKNRQKHYKEVPPFDEQKHPRKENKSGGRTGQDRGSRQRGKQER